MFPNHTGLVSFAIPKAHYILTAGIIIPFVPDNIELKPPILLKDDVAGPTSIDLNAPLLLKKRVWIGAGYRTGIKLYNKSNLTTPHAKTGQR